MKRLSFLAVAVALGISAAAWAEDPPSPFSLGANLPLGNLGGTSASSPFSNGLGQIVSGWTQQGIRGPELADRIHWLQTMRTDEIAQRTRWMDQNRWGGDNWFNNRDIREDRREIF